MTTARAKGTRAERQVEAYLNEHGFRCKRIGLAGIKDEGDIWVPEWGILSVKDVAHHRIGQWLREAEEQAANAAETRFALVVKERRGPEQSGATEDWWVVQRLREWITCLT